LRQIPTIEERSWLTDPRWLAVERILASPKFCQATRLSGFLRYVSERALTGKPDEATEQQVGIHVFGRTPGYNPAEDNIVRSTARQVRERLALYYQEEGQEDPIRIVLARGSYLPAFEERIAEPVAAPPVPLPAPTSSRRTWLTAGFAATALAGAAWATWRPRPETVWDWLTESPKPLLLVPGDSGTVIRQNLTGHSISVADYASGATHTVDTAALKKSVVEDLSDRRYTSFADLKFATRLAMLPQIPRERFSIRFARDLHVDDLKAANIILVGAPQGNPWVELFHKDLNFQIHSNETARTLTVVNRQPRPGEKATYEYVATTPNRRAYALLAFRQNLDQSGAVLLVQGTTVAGIEAATDFLFNEENMAPILRQAKAGRSFEVLLETEYLNASSVGTVVRATRLGR
jgi:hypothetical protein